MAAHGVSFARRPESTRYTTVGKPGWRRRNARPPGPRCPSLILDALVDTDWSQTWTA